MRCTNCRAENRAKAPFCIECGEPLELGNSPYLVEPEAGGRSLVLSANAAFPYRPATTEISLRERLNPLRWSVEVKVGVLILIAVLVFDLVLQTTSKSDAERYHLGLDAISQQHWHAAADELRPLVGKRYQEADRQYEIARQKVAAVDQEYNQATTDEQNGRGWKAISHYRAASQIERGYKDARERSNSLLVSYGKVIYNRPETRSGGRYAGGLYVSDIDGGNSRSLGYSFGDSSLHAISTDGRRVLYSSKGMSNVYLSDLYRGLNLQVADFYNDEQQSEFDAAFLDGGDSTLAVSRGKIGVATTDAASITFVYYKASRFKELAHQDNVALVARPNYGDRKVYYVTLASPASGSNSPTQQVSAYNSEDDSRTSLFQVSGQLLWLRVVGSPPGLLGPPQALLYSVQQGADYSVRLTNLDDSHKTSVLASYRVQQPLDPSRVVDFGGKPPLLAGNAPILRSTVAVSRDDKWAILYVPDRSDYLPYLLDLDKQTATAWASSAIKQAEFSPDASSILLTLGQPTHLEVRNRQGVATLVRRLDHMVEGGFLDNGHFYYTLYHNLSGSNITLDSYVVDVSGKQVDRYVAGYAAGVVSTPPVVYTADGLSQLYLSSTGVYIGSSDGNSYLRLAEDASGLWMARNGWAK